jgi:DNA-binding GntR family transcriptional regulator
MVVCSMVGALPSGKTLSQDYDVSHGSAERALAILREEGLVYAVVGKGHYVKRT